jgi:hypothetical protein
VDLALLDSEVDAVVGNKAPKAFGDPTQLELQRGLLANMARPGAVRYLTAPGRALVTSGL